jgi:hypothetical protein
VPTQCPTAYVVSLVQELPPPLIKYNFEDNSNSGETEGKQQKYDKWDKWDKWNKGDKEDKGEKKDKGYKKKVVKKDNLEK